ncbi:MAG: hypothetical protein GY716_15820 [bacterium]|nr:hypothetical protein [bacterium]
MIDNEKNYHLNPRELVAAYWDPRRDCWSVRVRRLSDAGNLCWVVAAHTSALLLVGATLKVSTKGRDRELAGTPCAHWRLVGCVYGAAWCRTETERELPLDFPPAIRPNGNLQPMRYSAEAGALVDAEGIVTGEVSAAFLGQEGRVWGAVREGAAT